MQEALKEVADIGSIIAPIAVLADFAPAIVLVLTVPYLIYRGLYMRQKWINEKNGGYNGEANHD